MNKFIILISNLILITPIAFAKYDVYELSNSEINNNIAYASLKSKADDSVDKVISYTNGMYNNLDSALLNRAHLAEKLDGKLDNHRVDLAYNKSDDKVLNSLQALAQSFFELSKLVETGNMDAFWKLLDTSNGLKNAPIIDQETYQYYLDFFENQNLPLTESQLFLPNIKTHIGRYEKFIADGKTVVLVPHSQGCFYANSTMQLLFSRFQESRDRLFNVAIAPSSSILMPNSTYYTNHLDLIVGFVRSFNNYILPNNLTINPQYENSFWGWLAAIHKLAQSRGHGFKEDYLSGGEHTDKIVNQIKTYANSQSH